MDLGESKSPLPFRTLVEFVNDKINENNWPK